MIPSLKHAEDLSIGQRFELGSYDISLDEIIDFAEKWDPLPMHTDIKFAQEGPFGEIIASALHSMSILQRLSATGAYRFWDVIAGRRLREIEAPAPVKAGMSLRGTMLVESIEHRGAEKAFVVVQALLHHQDTLLLSSTTDMYMRRRPIEAQSAPS